MDYRYTSTFPMPDKTIQIKTVLTWRWYVGNFLVRVACFLLRKSIYTKVNGKREYIGIEIKVNEK